MSPEEGGEFVKMLRATFSTIAVGFLQQCTTACIRLSMQQVQHHQRSTHASAGHVTCHTLNVAFAFLTFKRCMCSAVFDTASIEWV